MLVFKVSFVSWFYKSQPTCKAQNLFLLHFRFQMVRFDAVGQRSAEGGGGGLPARPSILGSNVAVLKWGINQRNS